MRTIVSVGTGKYVSGLDRLVSLLPQEKILFWRNVLPPHSPLHEANPYAFKLYAILEAIKRGYDVILWLDSSIVPIKPIEPLWKLIETQGYWLSRNLKCWNCGQWTSDLALPLLGITREEAFLIPQVAATAFGLDMRKPIAKDFLRELSRLANNGSFVGPWTNEHGLASNNSQVLGHRHDQTAMSIIAARLGMHLTEQPEPFSDYQGETEGTILTVQRLLSETTDLRKREQDDLVENWWRSEFRKRISE